MTAGLLDLAELSARSGVPAKRLRHYAEAGLVPPARRDGDCPGTQRLLADAVTARLEQVQADLAARNRQAVEAGPGAWQQVLGQVERRDPLPDNPDGVALRFPFDVDLAGTLARPALTGYRCCSFGSHTLVVDGGGLRLEIRMPAGAAGTLAAVVALPDVPAGSGDAR